MSKCGCPTVIEQPLEKVSKIPQNIKVMMCAEQKPDRIIVPKLTNIPIHTKLKFTDGETTEYVNPNDVTNLHAAIEGANDYTANIPVYVLNDETVVMQMPALEPGLYSITINFMLEDSKCSYTYDSVYSVISGELPSSTLCKIKSCGDSLPDALYILPMSRDIEYMMNELTARINSLKTKEDNLDRKIQNLDEMNQKINEIYEKLI